MAEDVLTYRDKHVLDFIIEYQQKHQEKPSQDEIMDALGIKSASQVWKHINKLIRAGKISKPMYVVNNCEPAPTGR